MWLNVPYRTFAIRNRLDMHCIENNEQRLNKSNSFIWKSRFFPPITWFCVDEKTEWNLIFAKRLVDLSRFSNFTFSYTLHSVFCELESNNIVHDAEVIEREENLFWMTLDSNSRYSPSTVIPTQSTVIKFFSFLNGKTYSSIHSNSTDDNEKYQGEKDSSATRLCDVGFWFRNMRQIERETSLEGRLNIRNCIES